MSTPDSHDPYRRPPEERRPLGPWQIAGLLLAVGLGVAGLAFIAFFILAFLSLGSSSSNK